MEDVVLNATERTAKPRAARRAGFVPAVLHEKGKTSISIQLDASSLSKVVSHHGSKAKIWIKVGSKRKKFGYIKELQRNPLDHQIIHAAIQIVAKDSEIKMLMPINFTGLDALERKQLQLHIMKGETEIFGKTIELPDSIVVDVSELEANGSVGPADLGLPEGIKAQDPDDEIYAIVKVHHVSAVEEPAEEAEEMAEPELVSQASEAEES